MKKPSAERELEGQPGPLALIDDQANRGAGDERQDQRGDLREPQLRDQPIGRRRRKLQRPQRQRGQCRRGARCR